MHLLIQRILTLSLALTLFSSSASLSALPPNPAAPAFSPLRRPTSEINNLTLPSTFNNTFLIDPFNATLNSSFIASRLPYIYHVPGTRLWLRLGFGDDRVALDEFDLGGILALANATIQEHIEQFGANRLFNGWYAGDRQWFLETLHDSERPLGLSIKSERTGEQLFKNQELADVIRGLDIYLRQGGRFYQTRFTIFKGLLGTTFMGSGFVARLTPRDSSNVQQS